MFHKTHLLRVYRMSDLREEMAYLRQQRIADKITETATKIAETSTRIAQLDVITTYEIYDRILQGEFSPGGSSYAC